MKQIINIKDKELLKTLLMIIFFVITGVASRLLPHMYNFTPIIGIALFLSYRLNSKWSIFFILTTMLISDLIIGFDSLEMRILVYSSFLVPSFMGLLIKNQNQFVKRYFTIFATSFSSAVIFYLITNFGVWLWSGLYPHTSEGLTLCYTMALPFFRNSLMGDLFSSFFIFGIYDSILYLVNRYQLSNILKEKV